MTIQNPYEDGPEETADLVRSLALSSAKLWGELFNRLRRIEAAQSELRELVASLEPALPEAPMSPAIGRGADTTGELPVTSLASTFEEALSHTDTEIESVVSGAAHAALGGFPESGSVAQPDADFSLSFSWQSNDAEAAPPAVWQSSHADVESEYNGSTYNGSALPDVLPASVEFDVVEVLELQGTYAPPPPPPPPPSPTLVFEAPASVTFEAPSSVTFEAPMPPFAPAPPPPAPDGYAAPPPPPPLPGGFASASAVPPSPPPGFEMAQRPATCTPAATAPPPPGFSAAPAPPPPPGFSAATPPPPPGFSAAAPPPPPGFSPAPPPPPGFGMAPPAPVGFTTLGAGDAGATEEPTASVLGEASPALGVTAPTTNGHSLADSNGGSKAEEQGQAFAITPDFFARAGRRRP